MHFLLRFFGRFESPTPIVDIVKALRPVASVGHLACDGSGKWLFSRTSEGRALVTFFFAPAGLIYGKSGLPRRVAAQRNNRRL